MEDSTHTQPVTDRLPPPAPPARQPNDTQTPPMTRVDTANITLCAVPRQPCPPLRRRLKKKCATSARTKNLCRPPTYATHLNQAPFSP
jgi:hypothetical protein